MQATNVIRATSLCPMSYPIAAHIRENLDLIHNMANQIVVNFQTEINFINLVCRGSSGAMISAIIASRIPQVRRIYYIRKETESTHSMPFAFSSEKPKKGDLNIFVDDFMESGNTFIETVKGFGYPLHGVVVTGSISHAVNKKTSGIIVDKVICYDFYGSK